MAIYKESSRIIHFRPTPPNEIEAYWSAERPNRLGKFISSLRYITEFVDDTSTTASPITITNTEKLQELQAEVARQLALAILLVQADRALQIACMDNPSLREKTKSNVPQFGLLNKRRTEPKPLIAHFQKDERENILQLSEKLKSGFTFNLGLQQVSIDESVNSTLSSLNRIFRFTNYNFGQPPQFEDDSL